MGREERGKRGREGGERRGKERWEGRREMGGGGGGGNRDTTLGGNLASTLLKKNTYSRHQRSSYSVREELQVICDGV